MRATTNPATFNYMEQFLDVFKNTPASQWAASPEVTAWCDDARRDREAGHEE